MSCECRVPDFPSVPGRDLSITSKANVRCRNCGRLRWGGVEVDDALGTGNPLFPVGPSDLEGEVPSEMLGSPGREPTVLQAEALWQLLDNIDTLDDTCRGDDAAYRRSVKRLVAERFKVADSNGYRLNWRDAGVEDYAAPGWSYPIPPKGDPSFLTDPSEDGS